MQLPMRYLVDFTVLQEGEQVFNQETGLYESSDPVEEPVQGIILPLNNDEMKYGEVGTYTVQDRKVYVSFPLKVGQQIKYKDDRYTIRAEKDYGDLADVYIYFAKRVGESSA
ncbi:hypothetical protein J2S78_002061 [Salibacterium salarium]|uniref:hypothetical protein n=1 Tax=Salibacterium salarium TaxID=284579 RepID=UPI0027878CBC|nr:hypothetical protein [Salibacterium salarium]MDQ0299641.1 hypothetical protein [Salibacterium salarium]